MSEKDLTIEEINGGVIFSVKVVPGSSRTCVAGFLGGMLKVKLAAPAERGKANQALIELLSKTFGVKKNQISILTGHTNPVKRIQITNLTANNVKNKFFT
jgi:uncharacterized protein (TIGR00251 family)